MKPVAWRALLIDGREITAKRRLLNAFGKLPDGMNMLSLVLYFDEARPDGKPYREIVDGKDHYVAWNSPEGLKFFCSNDPIAKIETKYPGCVIKLGIEIPYEEFRATNAQAFAAVDPP